MNIDKDAETDDATAEPAEPAAAVAKRVPGADFEPGPDSPLNDDGSPKWSATAAYQRWAAQIIPNEQAEAAKGREATMAAWWPKEDA